MMRTIFVSYFFKDAADQSGWGSLTVEIRESGPDLVARLYEVIKAERPNLAEVCFVNIVRLDTL